MTNPVFQYHPAILERYPNLVGGVIVGRGLTNRPSPPELLDAYRAEQQAVLKRIGDTPLSQIESLAAWRGVFRSFGVDPTQIRSACEALLRRLTKQGDIPSINLLVDIGNLVSIRYGLPVAVVDGRAAQGAITVHFAEGDERFTNLGTTEVVQPDKGEVIFSDEAKLVFARRWCWRQSDESAAREDTQNVVVTVEAHHANATADVEAAVRDLLALLQTYAGGEYRSDILSQAKTSI
jgi:DNA/RNA-binding domain of Phe-tRNA-synthetase-like protein